RNALLNEFQWFRRGTKRQPWPAHAVADIVVELQCDGNHRRARFADGFLELERRGMVEAELRVDRPAGGIRVVVDRPGHAEPLLVEGRPGVLELDDLALATLRGGRDGDVGQAEVAVRRPAWPVL